MKTRRIEGTDIQAALREVRRTLGSDAVIMSTRETVEGIEIVAAAPPRAAVASRREAAPPRVPVRKARAVTNGGYAALVSGLARPVAALYRDLDADLDAMGLSRDVRDVLRSQVSGVAPAHALDTACMELSKLVRVEGPALMRDGGRVAVLGGTGVGKTTTIAKLAAHYARRHGPQAVALINADQYRIGASDQLRCFARLIGVPVFDVCSTDGLRQRLAQLRDRALVLVDTAGIAERDVRFKDQKALLEGAELDCYLALSLNAQSAVLARGVSAYAGLRLRGCILTKEDEAISLGGGLSVAVRHRLPVSFVTTGPQVPADIRIAEAAKLVTRARALGHEVSQQGEHYEARPAPAAARAEAAR